MRFHFKSHWNALYCFPLNWQNTGERKTWLSPSQLNLARGVHPVPLIISSVSSDSLYFSLVDLVKLSIILQARKSIAKPLFYSAAAVCALVCVHLSFPHPSWLHLFICLPFEFYFISLQDNEAQIQVICHAWFYGSWLPFLPSFALIKFKLCCNLPGSPALLLHLFNVILSQLNSSLPSHIIYSLFVVV